MHTAENRDINVILFVGQMDQSMNLKEKWVYEEKVISYKKWLQIIYNSYM